MVGMGPIHRHTERFGRGGEGAGQKFQIGFRPAASFSDSTRARPFAKFLENFSGRPRRTRTLPRLRSLTGARRRGRCRDCTREQPKKMPRPSLEPIKTTRRGVTQPPGAGQDDVRLEPTGRGLAWGKSRRPPRSSLRPPQRVNHPGRAARSLGGPQDHPRVRWAPPSRALCTKTSPSPALTLFGECGGTNGEPGR